MALTWHKFNYIKHMVFALRGNSPNFPQQNGNSSSPKFPIE
jgi:hypothetical protein